jgi:hypothetical protein
MAHIQLARSVREEALDAAWLSIQIFEFLDLTVA